MSLLTESNPKLEKGLDLGYVSFGLHFAPHNISGYQTCASASAGCAKACLYTSGHGKFTRTQEARIRKTQQFFEARPEFLKRLVKDMDAGIRRAGRLNLLPAFRLNLTSDIRWETVKVDGYVNLMALFDGVQFYDYTKHVNRRNIPHNYHLTFSRSETNDHQVQEMFDAGMNTAIVFDTPKNKPLPETYMGRKVIDGRTHDLRFLDPQGVWVGLSALGDGKKDESGFIVNIQRKVA